MIIEIVKSNASPSAKRKITAFCAGAFRNNRPAWRLS